MLALPTIADKAVILPRAPEAGERFRLIVAERQPRVLWRSEAIGENDAHSARSFDLEMLALEG